VVRGKYQIIGKVGQGGMAAVYKALHVRFKEPRALKVINPELANDASFVRRSHGRNLLPVPQDDDEAALRHGSICCDQSAVAMRLCSGQPSTNLTLLPRSSATSRTTHREYLFWAEDPFHAGQICPKNHVQEWSFLTTTADFGHYRMIVTVTSS
jgi:serine/threonine protein kinase